MFYKRSWFILLLNYRYIAVEKLHERLQDLSTQFANPQSRPWKLIDWQTINRNQIIGLDAEVFLSILIGAMNTEAPIRSYTQTSRQYLEKLHPQMARFVGGTVGEDGELLELGLWEKGRTSAHTCINQNPKLAYFKSSNTKNMCPIKTRLIGSVHSHTFKHQLHFITFN